MRSMMTPPPKSVFVNPTPDGEGVDIRDYLTDEILDEIYDILVRHAGAPDGHIVPESVRAQFRIQAKAGIYRFRFGGDLLDWEGSIVLKKNCFTIPITDRMKERHRKIVQRVNEKLGVLREERFPRRHYPSNPR